MSGMEKIVQSYVKALQKEYDMTDVEQVRTMRRTSSRVFISFSSSP